VPNVPRDKLVSIKLSTKSGTEAEVGAIIPDSYFERESLNPDSVKGYVDENEFPLGQGAGEPYSFQQVTVSGDVDFNQNGTLDDSSHAYNDS